MAPALLLLGGASDRARTERPPSSLRPQALPSPPQAPFLPPVPAQAPPPRPLPPLPAPDGHEADDAEPSVNLYPAHAAAIYAAFGAMPNASAVADRWNALQGVRRAVEARRRRRRRGEEEEEEEEDGGARVVELGCGAGACARSIAAMPGVSAVLGIDRSEDQLALCRATPAPANLTFARADLRDIAAAAAAAASDDDDKDDDDDNDDPLARQLGTFDVALMEFVTSHAGTQADLDAMVRAAAVLLRPGGQLVVVEAHPGLGGHGAFPASERYAIAKEFVEDDGGGGGGDGDGDFAPVRTTFITPAGRLSVVDYHHSARAWALASRRAGFSEGSLVIANVEAPPPPPAATPSAAPLPPGFWDGYVRPDHPSGCAQAAVITAIRREEEEE